MGSRPTVAVVAAACVVATTAAAGFGAAAAPAGGQQDAVLRRTTPVYAAPRAGARVVERLSAERPITGEPTTLPIAATRLTHGGTWLRVLLPGRPNGRQGWIRRSAADVGAMPWRLVVDRAQRRLTVFDGTRLVRSFRVVVGKPSTPTPAGSFFVEETVALARSAVGAPDALALSARSNVLQEFDGGPGQIAIHGVANVGGVLGTAASHGCVRVSTDAIEWLAGRIGPGVPVTIR